MAEKRADAQSGEPLASASESWTPAVRTTGSLLSGGVGKCEREPWASRKASRSSMPSSESQALGAGDGGNNMLVFYLMPGEGCCRVCCIQEDGWRAVSWLYSPAANRKERAGEVKKVQRY